MTPMLFMTHVIEVITIRSVAGIIMTPRPTEELTLTLANSIPTGIYIHAKMFPCCPFLLV